MIWIALFWAGMAIVFVSYAGYGLWIALLARIRPAANEPPELPEDQLPGVTCLMAAANEGSLMERKLDNLTRQDYPAEKLEIIVVSDASTDDTDRIVTEWSRRNPRIRLLRASERGGKARALNLGRSNIQTEIMVLMDVRQEHPPNTIRDLVTHLSISGVGAVSGNLKVRGDSYWTYEGWVRRCESRSGSMVQVTGSLYAIRTSDFPRIPPDTILDDVYVPLTVALGGNRIIMAERAESLDVATSSVGNEFIRKVRTLSGLVQICHTLKECLIPWRNPVWGRFVLHKLFRLACPYGLVMMLAGSILAPGWLYRVALAGMAILVILAVAGKLGLRWRLTNISQALLLLNLAAFWAIPAYYLRRSSVVWSRVETDRT